MCSLLRSVSWASTPGGAIPSTGQTTATVFQLEAGLRYEHVTVDSMAYALRWPLISV